MNLKSIASFAVGPIAASLLGALTLPLITWFYPAEDVGRVAMLQVTVSLCVLLFSLGLDQSYVREYHESSHRQQLLKTLWLPGFVLLSVSLLIILIFPGLLSSVVFGMSNLSLSLLIGLSLIAAFTSRFLSLVLRMKERGIAFSMSQVLSKAVLLIIVTTFAFFSFGLEFYYLILAYTASYCSVVLVFGWNTRKEWFPAIKSSVDFQQLKRSLKFGAPLILSGIAYWGLTAVDKIFLRSLSSFEELGVYAVSTNFAAAAAVLQSIFSIVWAPTVYKWAAKGIEKDKIQTVIDWALIIITVVFCLAGLFSWVLDYLLPPDYQRVPFLVVTCLAAPLFYGLSEATKIGIGITRKSSYSMIASIAALMINIIGNIILIPKYGANGAAASTAVAFWVFFILRTEFSFKLWMSFPRLKLYFLSFLSLIVALLYLYLGTEYFQLFMIIWSALLVALAAFHINYFKNASRYLRKKWF